ncbi:hypothetical protein GCM10022408_16640 [Hymenobacter fastidiosus]|uniref:PKD domain-containing protein n=1 Tax=Hymenobacter fastidiosus TaxID=486264 RepID=A0ABP7S246_9BACT
MQEGFRDYACTTPHYSQTEDYAVTIVANIQAPAANFTADQTLTCSGRVQFTDQTQNAPTSWLWNFGDNTTNTQRNPLHQYAAAGTYTVTLTATNPVGSNTRTRAGYISYDSQVPVAATCTPATTAYCCGYGIMQFTLGTLASASTDGAAGYEDFTCTRRLSTPAGSRLSWAVQTGGTNVHDVRGYLDLNDDGQFTASELLFSDPRACGQLSFEPAHDGGEVNHG